MRKLKEDSEIQRELNSVEFIVEANDFERHVLWEKWFHREARVSWNQVLSGYGVTIGTIDDRPIVLSLNFAFIEGRKVLFHHVCSQLADYKMAEDWLEMHCNPVGLGGRKTSCDAQNFHVCVHTLQALNERFEAEVKAAQQVTTAKPADQAKAVEPAVTTA
jgi:hypothetical protein